MTHFFSGKKKVVPDEESDDGNSIDCAIPLALPQRRFWIRICVQIHRRLDLEVIFQGQAQQITLFKMREETLKATLSE